MWRRFTNYFLGTAVNVDLCMVFTTEKTFLRIFEKRLTEPVRRDSMGARRTR